MTIKHFLTLLLLGSTLLVQADPMMSKEHHPRTFARDTVTTFGDGSIVREHVDQSVKGMTVERHIRKTNAKGQTETRSVVTTHDPATHHWTMSVEGVRFNGEHYSMHSEGQGEGSMQHGMHEHEDD